MGRGGGFQMPENYMTNSIIIESRAFVLSVETMLSFPSVCVAELRMSSVNTFCLPLSGFVTLVSLCFA